MSPAICGSPSSPSVYDVPLALDHDLERTRGLELEHAKSRNLSMGQHTQEYIIGPMPTQTFLEDFLPLEGALTTESTLAAEEAFSYIPPRAATVAEISGPLLEALNKISPHKSRCPGFVFGDTCACPPFARKLGHMNPHICCYRADNADVVEHAAYSSRAELGYAEFFIEVKSDPSYDFFADPQPPLDAHSNDRKPHEFLAPTDDPELAKSRKRAWGQQVVYAGEIFARQHRTHLFSVSMSGSCARFIRWDRAGCVVSEAFDVRARPEVLCEFLGRFARTGCAGRGHDLAVEPALPEEEGVFREAVAEHVRFQLDIDSDGAVLEKAVSEHYRPGHVIAMHVLQHRCVAEEGTIRRFLVSRPVASSVDLEGRGTRGWWAVDPRTRQVVFLKDTWRGGDYRCETEGDALASLDEGGVRNIPSVVCYGDVPGYLPHTVHTFTREEMQRSLSHEYCAAPWVCRVNNQAVSVHKCWHYRIVTGTVGYGLRTFVGTEELLNAAYDVFQAIRDAFVLGLRLHRDISIGNIILVREPGRALRKGYLIDWDASCKVDGESGNALEIGRAGTWLFMSHRLLDFWNFDGKHTIQDDIESLLYVVLYCALLWVPHALCDQDLETAVDQIFEGLAWDLVPDHHPLVDSGRYAIMGGLGKFANAFSHGFTRKAKFPPPLHEWLHTVMDHCVTLSGIHSSWIKRDRTPWSPEQLDAFWGEVLQTGRFEPADRVVHNHPYATGRHARKTANMDSTEAIVWSARYTPEEEQERGALKRKSECESDPESDPELERKDKRPRLAGGSDSEHEDSEPPRGSGECGENCS